MTEFEKWNKIHHINDLCLGNEITAKHKEQERSKGWKAALEWVLERHGPLGERVHNADYARAIIREELNE